jgi:hypothetical protein
MMVKMIFHGSYLLGILSLVVALVIRALSMVGINLTVRGNVGYGTFYRGSALLMIVAIASACYCMLENRKQQG